MSNGEDDPTVADLIRWLHETAERNERLQYVPPQQWETRLLPHVARRLRQAAAKLAKLHNQVISMAIKK